jgi:ketosteroid isomerase-like protein
MTKLTIPIFSCLLTGLLTVYTVNAQSSQASAPAFRTALETHLSAISGRNMDALLPTITGGKDLPMIAPNGFKFDTRQQYVDFHRQWFATKDQGKLDFEIVRVIETPALALALVKYRYSSRDKAGKLQVSYNWLALTFAFENGSWRLVFDQNTPIEARASTNQ